MRRRDRQVTELDEIKAIVSRCGACRLGMIDGERPYVVPMSFGYEFEGERLTLYFHCATEGRKLDIIRKSPLVCFELDDNGKLTLDDTTFGFSYHYESIIGSGTAEILEDTDEKVRALKLFMQCAADGVDFEVTPEVAGHLAVFRIQADEYTAKRG